MSNRIARRDAAAQTAFEALTLTIGARALVTLASPKRRYQLQLLGRPSNQTLLLSEPVDARGKVGLEGCQLELHVALEHGVCRFSGRLLKVVKAPLSGWLVSVPEQVHYQGRARHLKALFNLPVGIERQVHSAHCDIPSMLLCTELSCTQLLAQSPVSLGSRGDAFFLTLRLSVSGVDQVILISAQLKEAKLLSPGVYEHSFTFYETEDESKVIIAAAVYQQLLTQLGYIDE
ncbi:MAG: hypothetical protein ACPG4U_03315 [Pseudomonadales bacterium]